MSDGGDRRFLLPDCQHLILFAGIPLHPRRDCATIRAKHPRRSANGGVSMATDSNSTSSSPTPSHMSRVARSPGLKLLVIAALTVVMAIPLFLIQLALADRQQTAAGAAADIAAGYGGTQVVAGPVLLLPYTIPIVQYVDGKTIQTTQHYTAVVLPEDLKFDVHATTSTRYRGIFPVPVYQAGVAIRATFDKASLTAWAPPEAQIDWKNASVAVLVSDAHGLADNVSLNVNGNAVPFEPGPGLTASAPYSERQMAVAGMRAKLDLMEATNLDLNTSFTLRGSREFSVSPLGRRTVATIDSPWPSPSFFGAYLPTTREVGKGGFTASWTVPYLARGFGQSFSDSGDAIQALLTPAFGAKFYQPVDHYQLVERSLKYAILFVALAYLVFFVVETVAQRRIHFVQYALVGVAQVLFYLLLLSVAEHTGFALAYLIAAGATIVLTSLYAISALSSKWRAAVLCVILSGLYALLYVILNSEDFALLIGSGVLFAALTGTMYFTRKIDWYRVTEHTGA
jgi:inner membrane protein